MPKTVWREVPTQWLEAPYEPVAVSDLLLAFPAAVEHLMPAPEDIPEVDDKWTRVVRTWFYKGLSADAKFYMRDGIDGEKAFRHLSAILRSFQPKHEHKEAAMAYLLSLWCEEVEL